MMTNPEKSKILIVEDELISARLLEARVKGYGHIPIGPAGSGEEAIRLAVEEKPELVLMDITLQGELDGIEAAKIIKEKTGAQIIYVTAHSEEEFFQRAKPTTPVGYIAKPFQDKELRTAVEMALYAGKLDAERRRTEEALRESEQKYRQLFNYAPAGIYDIDFIRNKITSVNDVACHISGYSREEIMEMNPLDFLGAESQMDFIKRLEAHSQGDAISDSLEYEIITKSGQSIWALLSISFKTEGDRIIGASVVAHDITEKKLAEKKLKEAEEKLQVYRNDLELYAQLTPLGIIVFDNEFNVLTWNPGAEKIFGYSAREAIGKNTFDILVPEYERDQVKKIHQLVDPKVTVNVNDNITKDGRIITVQWFNSPRLDSEGNLTGLITACQDISESKKAEKLLRESEEKYRTTFESIPDIVTITEISNGRYHFVNEAFSEITGYSREEVIGRTPTEINIYAYPEIRKSMMKELQEKGRLLNFEIKFRKKDGTFFDSLFSAKPITIDNQDCLVALTKDITKQKQMESEKRLLEEQLKQAQKMEAIGVLAGGIAHDFNNLLQAISGYAQLLLMEKSAEDSEYSKLQEIDKSTSRASELVQQLLLFSRKVDAVRKPVELSLAVEEAQKILERTIPKMIDIEIHIGARLWKILADPVQIEQILLNLGTNAADAMPEGGRLILEMKNAVLDENFCQNHLDAAPGKYVLLTVSDTGQGMSSETKEKIFEPFFTTKEFGKGTGLGLASVYGIVKAHGGSILCYSELGAGTSFKIYLPAIEGNPEQARREPSNSVPKGGPETILLVDDECSIRDLTSQVLENFGYTALTAASGEEALELFSSRRNEIDLVVLDLGMPGMGGHRCFKELQKIDPGVDIIIASGYSIHGPVKKTLEAGARDYVGKPYQIRDLLGKIRSVLDKGR